jgi:hypothetical protein
MHAAGAGFSAAPSHHQTLRACSRAGTESYHHDPFVFVLIQQTPATCGGPRLELDPDLTPLPTRALPPADFELQVVAKTTGAGGAARSSSSEAGCAVKLFPGSSCHFVSLCPPCNPVTVSRAGVVVWWIPKQAALQLPLLCQIIIVPADSGLTAPACAVPMSMRALPYRPPSLSNGRGSLSSRLQARRRTACRRHGRGARHVGTTAPPRHSPRGDDPVVAPAPYPCHPHQRWDLGVVAVAVAARHHPPPERSPARARAGHGVAR